MEFAQDEKEDSLHMFCDASAKAYATCIFLRVVRLIQSRGRVLSLKNLTFPRLTTTDIYIDSRLCASEQLEEVNSIAIEIKSLFLDPVNGANENLKWSLLKDYSKYFISDKISLILLSSYNCVTTVLLDSLKPTLFKDKWSEDVFDNIFLHGIHHESFILLMRKLNETRESYQRQKILSLLARFIQEESLYFLLLRQCCRSGLWDPEYAAISKTWNDLLMFLASLPERVANKTQGHMHKIFYSQYYVPRLLSSIIGVLTSVHQMITGNQNCTLEFLGKLIGKLSILGHGDVVVQKLYMVLISYCEKDYVWRKISQNLITKMPLSSLEPFVTHLVLLTPWYGYLDWILGDEGMNNKNLNYVMTTKLLLFHHFEKKTILHNIIGYFAKADNRQVQFENIFSSLAKCWANESTLKHQSFQQQKYLASALLVCAGWLKTMQYCTTAKAHLNLIINGTMIRLANSEQDIRSLGLVVGNLVASAIDPQGPTMKCEEIVDKILLTELEALLIIPNDPGKDSLCLEDVNLFVEEKSAKEQDTVKKTDESTDKVSEIDSDDELEPYVIPEEQVKRPYYLNDCLQGLIEQENDEWFEQCLKHAESLIISNSDQVHEVAVEMAKVLLHLEQKGYFPDFLITRHKILVSLAVHCPVLVADYLANQFYEKDYSIRQRLDILEVLAAASQLLSTPKSAEVKHSELPSLSSEKFNKSTEKLWKTIVDTRVAAKTRHITKVKRKPLPELLENRFAVVAGYFFFPLMAKYDKKNKMLKLFGEDSYVLGRLIYTLGIIMHSAANIPACEKMGEALLQFIADVKHHTDVFVREASIFALAAVYTSVPACLLFSDDMTPAVFESKDWLQSVIDGDIETNCQIKATYALSLILNAITNEMPLVSELLSSK
ncbi:telomere length regulation protein TEL2 homolog [Caerostris darwini]|uniref:Telomere length regulation protein TEL2 homolog n=1 Tax=Caerostris darwini TaxID=1538125 RepID=A0AAV4SR50_9ARAC|nr:telomere length regulation protein TEL2 homolog [Caerostris darwini]